MTTTPSDSRTLSPAKLALLRQRLHSGASRAAGIPRRPAGEPIPLPPVQHALWLIDQALTDNAVYGVHRAWWLRGRLDVAALRSGVDELVRRHEILRTTYPSDGEPIQVVGPVTGASFTVVDTDRAIELAGVELRRPFDLANGPLLRTTLFRAGPTEHLLLINMHHLTSDGWSCSVAARELSELYSAFARGDRPNLPELDIQYADYAHWQANRVTGDLRDRQLDYWRQALSGISPVLRLPTDAPHPARMSHRAGQITRAVTPELTDAVRALAREHGVTLFTTLLTAFEAVLHRCCGQDTFAVGTLTSGRDHPAVQNLLGLFANTVAIPADLSGDPTFADLLGRAHRGVLGALDHQDVSFDQVVTAVDPVREPGRNPLFQVLFQIVEHGQETWRFAGLDAEYVDLHNDSGKVDLSLFAADRGECVDLTVEYATDVFRPETATRFADRIIRLLEQVVTRPAIRMSEVDILPAGERELVTTGWNDTAADVPWATLPELFEAAVRRSPDAVAVVTADGDTVSYTDLNVRANRLAHHLRGLGVGAEAVVGVCVRHSVDMFVALLGVLKSGAAYLPLDPEHPADRLAFMLADTGARVVVSQAAVAGAVPAEFTGRLVLVDQVTDGPTTDPVGVNTPDNLIYVMYTSGSTGRPKGVMIPHSGLVNYLWWAIEGYGLTGASGAPMLGSIAFDLSVPNFFLPLIAGKDVTLLPPERGLAALADLLRGPGDHSLLKLTPGHLDVLRGMLTESDRVSCVRTFVVGADEVRPETVAAWRRLAPDARIIDEYGPTETVVGCSTYLIGADFDPAMPVSIGRPIANTRMYVLGDDFEPLPVGVVGELFIGGAGVARGYLNRPGLTAEKFVPDPFASDPGARMYRTGDLARFRADGNLDFLGRIDHQVKILGYRVELGEIEARLLLHPQVGEAVVTARDESPGSRRLVGYVVPAPGASVDVDRLRSFVAQTLPAYMVPKAWRVLDRMPLTQAGKVDRAALPDPVDTALPAGPSYLAPDTPTEVVLAGIWARVLGVTQVGVRDDFFELGGDSILAIQIVAHARRAGVPVTVRQVFEHRTVAALAAAVSATAAIAVHAEQGLVTGPVPLTPIMKWFTTQRVRHDHYNQSVLLACPSVEPAVLERALRALVDHHDALRLRLSDCRAEIVADGAPIFRVARSADRDRIAADVSAGLSLVDGPTVAAVWFADVDELLLVVHHIAVDTVSWSILLADLETACDQLAAGEPVALPPKSTSFQYWANRLVDYANSVEPWTDEPSVPALPVDHETGPNTEGSTKLTEVELPAELTDALLRQVPAAYRTEINDVLLAVLARTLTEWAGGDTALVELEGHGREPLFDDVDVSRTVGWFTSPLPVSLPSVDGDWGARLMAVKERLRAIPLHGIGYGLARYVRGDHIEAGAELTFNYLGRLDRQRDTARFTQLPGELGPDRDPLGERPHLIGITAFVGADTLRLCWSYSANRHTEHTIRTLAERYVALLTELIGHCRTTSGGLSPSDFPSAGLDQSELDRLPLGGDGASARSVADIYPLTPLQAGMFFQTVADQGTADYFEQAAMVLRGDLDLDAFRAALEWVVDRHAVLRTSFAWDGLPHPVQIVWSHRPARVRCLDWTAVPSAAVPGRFDDLLAEDRAVGFDLTAECPSRYTLVRTGPDEFYFCWTYHHILLDRWSVGAVLGDVFARYAVLTGGADPALPDVVPYGDYVRWLGRQDAATHREYWRTELAGLAGPTRLAGSIRAGQDIGLGQVAAELPADLVAAVRGLAARCHCTVNTVLHTAWALLLHRYTGSRDVVFGTIVSGRGADVPGVERMVGLLVNNVPTRVVIDPWRSVADLLAERQERMVVLREHEHHPLVDIERRAGVPATGALFDTVYSYNADHEHRTGLPGLELTALPALERTGYPLMVEISHGERVEIGITHDRAAFDTATTQRLLDHFSRLVAGMVAAPDAALWRLNPLSDNEFDEAVRAHNDTAGPVADRSPAELLAEQVRRAPGATAIVTADGRELSYADFGALVERLVGALFERGVRPGHRVAVALPRDVGLFAALFAVLRVGAAYIPIDPDHPADRIARLLADSAPTLIVTTAEFAAGLPAGAAPVLVDPGAPAAAPPPVAWCAAMPAYVIYTSGSTGRPKGVVVSLGGVGNFVADMCVRSGVAPGARMLAVTTVSFDIAVLELLAPLTVGAAVVLADRDQVRDPDALRAFAGRAGVTHAQATPSLWRALAAEPGWLRSVHVLIGGEALPADLATVLFANALSVTNLYGPTETTIWSSACPLTADTAAEPVLGRPIANTELYVLDEFGAPVPAGVPGELCIGGAGVALGYLDQPALTADRFVPDPFGARPGARLYRTGDLARRRPDGELEFLGRTDHQVKIRGYRIELGEIETWLLRCPLVAQTVVVVHTDQGGHSRLVAYVVPAGENLDIDQVRAFLARQLPEHMVPGQFVPLAALPLTPAGKVDRAALPAATGPVRPAAAYVAPRTPVERMLADTWSAVLGVPRVGVHDNFFELGGDSILAMYIVGRVRGAGMAVTPRQLLAGETVAALAEQVNVAAPAETPATPAESAPATPCHPLTPLQAGMLTATLAASGSDPYFRQFVFDIAGDLDVSRFTKALQAVVDGHDALRTRFAWDGLPDPVQLVCPPSSLVVERWDGRHVPADERAAWLDRLLADERARSVDLTSAPPLRLVLVRTAADRHVLVWNTHHLMLDGWSLRLVLAEVFDRYAGGDRPPAAQFTDFLDWLARRPDTDAHRYWHDEFAGCPGRTPLPPAPAEPDTDALPIVDLVLDKELTAGLRTTARRARVTVGAIAQAAWSMLLYQETGCPDVVFGMTVSGRNADVPGIAELVGMLINTVPVRVVVERAAPVATWLRRIHDADLRRHQHEHDALTDIQRWSEVDGQRMFDTRIVFDGFGDADPPSPEPALAVTEIGAVHADGEYPLVLAVGGGTEPRVQVRCDPARYDRPAAERLAMSYVDCLRRLATVDPDRPLGGLLAAVAAAPPPAAAPADRPTDRTAPSTDAERLLAQVWSDVLGVADIGVHDDFFEAGGNSILVFQVVARAQRAGLDITVRQALRHRTIAELAAVAAIPAPSKNRPADTPDEIPLPPILRRFTAQDINHDHHNQSVWLTWRQPPDPDRLDRVLRAMVAHHEALRTRLCHDDGWRLTVAETEPAEILRVVDGGDDMVPDMANALNASLSLSAGPLLRAALFRDPGGHHPARLLIVAHQVAVDRVSWSILLDDLATGYRQLEQGTEPALSPVTSSGRQWAARLAEHARDPRFTEHIAYWRGPRPPTVPLPVDHPGAANTEGSRRVVTTKLPARLTGRLRAAATALSCRLDEALLSAVAGALTRWSRTSSIVVDLESHGREPLFDDVDLDRTVGWFTAVHPVTVHLPGPDDPVRRLTAVREQVRAVPHRGVDYGVGRYLAQEPLPELAAEVAFTCHGRPEREPDPLFEVAAEAPGDRRDPRDRRSHLIAVDAGVADGQVEVRWEYSAELHDRDTIEHLAQDCLAELTELATRPVVAADGPVERLFPYAPALVVPMARHRVPGAQVAVIADGALAAVWGQGNTGGDDPAPVGPDTLFQTCSVTKHVTTVGVLRLVQHGRLELDEQANRYLTTWRLPAPITVRQLLNHTAGLVSDLTALGYLEFPRNEAVPQLRPVLDSIRVDQPGGFRYANVHFAVVQQVVADVTGGSFATAMRSLVLDPLGLSDSGFEHDFPESRVGRVALGHLPDGEPYPGGWPLVPDLASGGLWSTAGDLATVESAILRAIDGDTDFLTRELATAMVTPVTGHYALATVTSRTPERHWFGHPGDRRTYQSLSAVDRNSGTGLVVLANIGGEAPFLADVANQLGLDINFSVRG